MAAQRPARWFERLDDGRVAIYSAPYPERSESVSLVPESDLSWYRAHFDVRQVWK